MTGDLIGSTLAGRYEVKERLVGNNIIEIYHAYRTDMKRDMTITTLGPQLAQVSDAQNAYQRAVRAAVNLQHNNIERVYEYNTQGNLGFKVAEYIKGVTLEEILHYLGEQRKLLPLPVVATIVWQVSSGLTYAFEQDENPMHRDVRPANIMLRMKNDSDTDVAHLVANLGPSDVVLTDYMASRVIYDAAQKAAPDSVPGMADYMSPELIQGKKGDSRVDVYSLGIVLYELLIGTVPFTGGKPSVVMQQHMQEAPVSPRSIRPDLPEAVEKIVMQALAKDPNKRYSDAESFGMVVKQNLIRSGDATQFADMPTAVIGRGTSSASVRVAPTSAPATASPASPKAEQPAAAASKGADWMADIAPDREEPKKGKKAASTSKGGKKKKKKKKKGGVALWGIVIAAMIVFVVLLLVALWWLMQQGVIG